MLYLFSNYIQQFKNNSKDKNRNQPTALKSLIIIHSTNQNRWSFFFYKNAIFAFKVGIQFEALNRTEVRHRLVSIGYFLWIAH